MQHIGFFELQVTCIIGLNDAERINKQLILIDLEIETKDFIDYTALADLCKQIAIEGQFLLLETLAEEIMQQLRTKWSGSLSLTIKKPAAIPGAAYAFVRRDE